MARGRHPKLKIWGVTYDAGKVSDVWLPILQPFPPRPNNTFAYTSSQTTVSLVRDFGEALYDTWAYTLDSAGA